MYKLTLEREARDDLRAMVEKGGQCKTHAARIAVFLSELKGNQQWLGELLTRKFRNTEFNVDKFVEFWDQGLDMWRVALYEYNFNRDKQWQMPYRILYGYDQQCVTFRVLGILPREFNYEAEHELTKRICRTYDSLGLPKHFIQGARRSSNKSH